MNTYVDKWVQMYYNIFAEGQVFMLGVRKNDRISEIRIAREWV